MPKKGVSKITVEELDIIVQASVEGAVKEFKKLLPEIQKQLSGIQKEFDKVNIKDIKANIDVKSVAKEVQKAKKQIQGAFDPNDVSGITFSNNVIDDEDIAKVVNYKEEVSKIPMEMQKIQSGKFVGYDTNSIQNFIDNYGEAGRKVDEVKEKTKGLNKEINQTGTSQSKLTSFFSTFKAKLDQAKTSSASLKDSFKQMPQITQNITNNIKKMGGGFKQGLGSVLKYAGALFSLRSIYSVLSNSANAWLSSQNAGAKQLSANIEYMKTAMGSAIAPVIQYITNLIYQLMRAIQSVVYAFSGINIFAKATASSIKGVAGSAKQASKSLSSVHSEISNVSENNSGSGTNPNIDLSKMDNVPNLITEAIKNGDWYEIGNIIGQKINEGLNNIPWDAIQNGARNIASAIGQGINGFVDGLDWSLLGSTIGNGINTAFTFANTFLTTINWGSIGTAIADFINSAIATTDWNLIGMTIANRFNATINFAYNFVTKFNWKKFGTSITKGISNAIRGIEWGRLASTLSTGVEGVLDSILEFLKNLDTEAVGQAVIDFLANVDWLGVAGQLIEIILRAILLAIVELPFMIGEAIGQKLAEGIDNAVEYVVDKAKENGGNVILGMLEGMAQIGDNIGQWIIDHIFNPFIDTFKNLFGIHSPSTVMTELGTFVIQGLLDGISSLVSNVTQIWNNIKENVKETFDSIKNTITDVWNNVLDTTSNVWNTIVSKIKEGVSGAWNAITSTFGNVVGWFREKFTQAWQAVKNVFSAGGAIFDGIKDGILNGLKTVVNGLIQGINKVIKVPFDGLNSALNTIRNVGIGDLKPFTGLPSISVPQIPQLAKGGVLYDDTIVRAGEYSGASSNPEIVSPQNIMYETTKRAFEDAMFNSNNNGQDIYLTLNVGDEEMAQVVIDKLGNIVRNTGRGLEAIMEGGK